MYVRHNSATPPCQQVVDRSLVHSCTSLSVCVLALEQFDQVTALQYDNGIFWIDYASVIRHFHAVYFNWNPELFLYRQVCVHPITLSAASRRCGHCFPLAAVAGHVTVGCCVVWSARQQPQPPPSPL